MSNINKSQTTLSFMKNIILKLIISFCSSKRKSQEARPVPGHGRPKPPPARKPVSNPKARCLYAYDAQDTDELSFNEGEVIEIIREGMHCILLIHWKIRVYTMYQNLYHNNHA